MTEKTILKGLSLADLETWFDEALGEKPFRGRQLFRWLYCKGARSFDEMTDLAKPLRDRLQELATVDALEVSEVAESADGTRKIVFNVPRTGGFVEAVWIPTDRRVTLCVSSQIGCAFGCAFCLTGKIGFRGNLTAGEIVDQVVWVRRLFDAERPVTNIVFMGMGEPLHNYDELVLALRLLTDDRGVNFSNRKITVSTVGLVPAIDRLAHEDVTVNLAVSLNATTNEVRDAIMPINKRFPIELLFGALRRFPLPNRRRITIEYVLLSEINDTPADARRLGKLVHGLPCKINLIPWNRHSDGAFERPSSERVDAFQNILIDHHLNCLVRETRGDDRSAACGQLGAAMMSENENP